MSQEDESSNKEDGTEPLKALDPSSISDMPYASLVQRKQAVTARLAVIGTKLKKPAPSLETSIPFTPKSDTHWDFLLKEMAWLAADFASERKRQLASGKKLAGGVEQYMKTKQLRRARELAEAEFKRRRRAGKISRHVRGWWHKVERVIAYKQKVNADLERRKAMNKQLVALVHQTERYGETLQHSTEQQEETCTIEEALAAGRKNVRSLKNQTTDYAKLDKEETADEFYGTTTSDSGSDGSFHVDELSTDDESTLLEAEATELAERRAREDESDDEEDDVSYYADPSELQKLKEEAEMSVDQVMERFRQEAEAVQNDADIPEQVDNDGNASTRRVRFARNVEQSTVKGETKGAEAANEDTQGPTPATTTRVTRRSAMPETDAGNEADDDADISDVEDFVDDQVASDDGSDEFEADRDEKDDETTIEAEERLGRDISAEDEINLLEQEGKMSIEELRKLYSSVDNDEAEHDDTQSDPSETGAASSSTHHQAQITPTDSTGMDESMFDADDTAEQDEFQPDEMEVDDETTMEAEERLGREMSHEQEMSLLQKEGEIPIEQLRAMYAEMESNSNDDEMSIDTETQSQRSQNESSLGDMLEHGGSDEDGEDFSPDEVAAVDDETTMEAEERLGRDMSYQDEINLLKRESEMSIEELRLLYAGNGNAEGDQSVDESIEDVDDETIMEAEERLGREETPVDQLRTMCNQMEDKSSDINDDQRRPQGRKRSRPESNGSDANDDGDAALEALKVAEEKARMTHASRPFLIAPWVKLREYQQIGLNWLVSIQTRRLNAILADEMVSLLNCMFRKKLMSFTTHTGLFRMYWNRAWVRHFRQSRLLRILPRTRAFGAHILSLCLRLAS